jgi:endonuclease YncB( thermonuclease family)
MKTFLLSLLLFVIHCPSLAQALSGRVVGVSDGDTLTILTDNRKQVKVRIAGIDAPEKAQAFGNVSKQNLSSLVFNRRVTVEGVKRDRYGRTVSKVLIDGHDAGLEQIRAGLAWHFKQYERDQSQEDRRIYNQAEEGARREKRGLWRDAAPVPPWNFRHPNAPARPQAQQSQSKSVGEVRGNKNSRIYHTPECKDYDRIAPQNRVIFQSEDEAKKAGFRKARNCG